MRISSSRNSRVFETAIRLLIRQTEFVHIGTATEPITVWMHIARTQQNGVWILHGHISFHSKTFKYKRRSCEYPGIILTTRTQTFKRAGGPETFLLSDGMRKIEDRRARLCSFMVDHKSERNLDFSNEGEVLYGTTTGGTKNQMSSLSR